MNANNRTVLAFSGSLRAESYNTALLNAAVKHASGGVDFDVWDGLGRLPMFNQDLDDENPPREVAELRRRVAAADGLLIVTPEHNASVPAALKNAIDWVSTPPAGGLLPGKPTAIAGASPGPFGSARGQLALRQILTSIGAEVLAKPEVTVFRCHERLDDSGNVTDRTTLSLLTQLTDTLADRITAH
ncbi:NADPH-dependent FMN reductase [Streptomyces sp. 891-h]|uniref:NADPH-dependent FMN reductase n=1 Tax=unclassified Streptomyces TaxID=2593676 RepID=UPI001FAB0191|nr:NADPH-dependent FMN reductase [Streptomyces sp. 891-h]UNZ21010.1 NAD(P)H-dependent oxidoreductase [Streptomyces sp. 891-h]